MKLLCPNSVKYFRYSFVARKLLFPLLAAVSIIFTQSAYSANLVIVKSKATTSYLISRAFSKGGVDQSYHMMKGRFYPGNIKENWEQSMPIDDIIKDVSVYLERNDYHLANESEESDLVIVLHYGISPGNRSNSELSGLTQNDQDDTIFRMSHRSRREISSMRSIEFQEDIRRKFLKIDNNEDFSLVELLGMDEAYRIRSSFGSERQILDTLMRDERYFVILMAYDSNNFGNNKKPLWSTHYNIRAKGQTFEQAIKDMNLVAGGYFGENNEELVRFRVTKKARAKLLSEIQMEPSK